MATPTAEVKPAEFAELPLELLILTPLVATVNAQKAVAESTKAFVLSMIDKDTKKPTTVDFNVERKELGADGKEQSKTLSINAPLLSIVPVPHLRIDSLTIHFKYEISQVTKTAEESSKALDGTAKTGGMLSPWVDVSFTGHVGSKSSTESTANRNGVLEINVHASESPVPEGLAKILSILSNSIQSMPAIEQKGKS